MTQSQLRCRTGIVQSLTLVWAPRIHTHMYIFTGNTLSSLDTEEIQI